MKLTGLLGTQKGGPVRGDTEGATVAHIFPGPEGVNPLRGVRELYMSIFPSNRVLKV